jgi:2-polyprenyl-3-methyl-5-hydroxy-6-metoxy-1,4-benzoquinol methylase
MNCQVCGGTASFAFTKNEYKIMRCDNCHHHFTDLLVTSEKVNEIYSDKYFFGGEEGYPDYLLEKDMLIHHGEYYARKIRRFVELGKVLDVGAAAGFLLKGFENIGWKGTGIEPNAKMVDYAKRILGIDMRQGILETVNLDMKFDLILIIQVIAHLSDLNRSILNVSNLLEDKGFVLIETWNRSSLTANLFGKSWHEYSPPSTLNFFSKRTLDLLMKKHNFHKVSSGRPKKQIISNHAKSLLKHKMTDSGILKSLSGMAGLIPDNVLLPYPAEDLFWALFQKRNS